MKSEHRNDTEAFVRELIPASEIKLSPNDQFAFWTALNAKPVLTPAQKRLGAIMRGGAPSVEPRPSGS